MCKIVYRGKKNFNFSENKSNDLFYLQYFAQLVKTWGKCSMGWEQPETGVKNESGS